MSTSLSAQPMLQAQDVSVAFGGVQALGGVSLSVEAGGHLAVIGPNGAGKSTLVNVLSGYLQPNSGTVTYQGSPVRSAVRLARGGMVRTFQNLELFDSMTVLDNLMVTLDGMRHRGESIRGQRERALEALDTFGLADRARDVVAAQPYGVRKLLELARVVASKPALVLLDEPVAGLANKAEYVERLASVLHDLGSAIILIEHDMATVARLASHVIVLDSGRIIAAGTYTEVSNDPRVISAYLGAAAQE